MTGIDLKRFHRTFFEESFEGVDAMEAALLRLDPAAADAETINGIFRAAHSIKGGAGTFGFTDVARFTHVLETLLDAVRSGKHQLSVDDVDCLLRSTDVVRGLLKAAQDEAPADTVAADALASELSQRLSGQAPVKASASAAVAAPASSGWQIQFEPRPELFLSGNDPLRILRELLALGPHEVVCREQALPSLAEADPERCYLAWDIQLQAAVTRERVVECFAWVDEECRLEIQPLAAATPAAEAESVAAPPAAPAPAAAAVTAISSAKKPGEGGQEVKLDAASTIRVATGKIDAMINLVGELVITQAMLQQLAGRLDPVHNESLLQGLSLLDRNTRLLQEAVMSTRMLQVDAVFSRFPRLVRDLAGKLGKQVRLQLVGESTELDKTVIEKIADPLTHLVRNSLDHGLEDPDERQASGKEATGLLTLRAAHQGGHILIEVIDDGRGLNRQRILAKAAERGLPCDPGMSDADVWQLIFAPGFSTAAEVTEVSGRGVGMDVVKRNIQSLGGSVELSSETGRGTTVLIRLPLTLAILDGMSVAVGDEVYILPLSSVIESLQPQDSQVKSIAGQNTVLRVRNDYLPLIDLREWFGLPGDKRSPTEAIVVIVETEARKIALQIDDLVGQQQVVIKSLDRNYRRVRGVSGATILGDGRVSLILDVAAIVRHFGQAIAA